MTFGTEDGKAAMSLHIADLAGMAALFRNRLPSSPLLCSGFGLNGQARPRTAEPGNLLSLYGVAVAWRSFLYRSFKRAARC